MAVNRHEFGALFWNLARFSWNFARFSWNLTGLAEFVTAIWSAI
jgi:hypothetical protein